MWEMATSATKKCRTIWGSVGPNGRGFLATQHIMGVETEEAWSRNTRVEQVAVAGVAGTAGAPVRLKGMVVEDVWESKTM